jgi:hypothetical protein
LTRCGDAIRHGIAACQIIEQRMARDTASRSFMAHLEPEINGAVPAIAETT